MIRTTLEPVRSIAMPPTFKQSARAAKLDKNVRKLRRLGYSDTDIFAAMAAYMPDFKYLLDTAEHGTIDELARRYPDFHYFAKILESIAQGSATGSIKVPRP